MMNRNEILKAAALESKYSIGARCHDARDCYLVIYYPELSRYDLERYDKLKQAIKRMRWRAVNVRSYPIGIVRNGIILVELVDKPYTPTLRERFHAMSIHDPLYYTFQDMWKRLYPDRSIGYGLWLVDQDAAFDMEQAS